MANGDYEVVMNNNVGLWNMSETFIPFKNTHPFSTQNFKLRCSTWNITAILLCYTQYPECVARPSWPSDMNVHKCVWGRAGVRWCDHLTEMGKWISLFAIWQRNPGPALRDQMWDTCCPHWDDIFMQQISYGDFSYARNIQAFFKLFCRDLKSKLLGTIIYACACVS